MAALELPGMEGRVLGERGGLRVVELFIGAQHPASGHMRLIVYLDGDIVVRVDPDVGYVHRTVEKLSEMREYVRVISLIERMTIIDACNVTLPYVEAVERLLGVEPPPRARYLRTILCELNRIASHLYGLAIGGIFLNHSTMYMWAMGDREVWLHLASMLTGARLTHTYPIFGGVRRDLPQGFRDAFEKAKRYMEKRLREYDAIFYNNPVVRGRLEGVGVLPRDVAVSVGATGPNLRASGVAYDARMTGYAAYGELGFEPVVGREGDALERVWVRLREIEASMELIERALREMPEGPFFAERYAKTVPPAVKHWLEKGRVKLPGGYVRLKTRPGEVLARGEMGRGEVTYFLVSDGGVKPYRLRIVTPSARNLVLFDVLSRGHTLMDVPAIYASIDYFPPEADR